MTQRYNFQDPERPDAFAAAPTSTLGDDAGITSRNLATPPFRARRAIRIAISLPVEMRDRFGRREQTHTLFVTIRGAVLATSSDLRVGHKLTIQNLKSGRTAECHVVGLESAAKQLHEVEVEFTAPQSDFWPVQFPAEDLKGQDNIQAHGMLQSKQELTVSASVLSNSGESSGGGFSAPSNIARDASFGSGNSGPARSHGAIVVLADSVAQDFSPASESRNPETFTSRPTVVDSVAEFRAANRAAHRRAQRIRAFYSLILILALAGSLYAARVWLQHNAEDVQPPAEEVIQTESIKKTVAKPAANIASVFQNLSSAAAAPASSPASSAVVSGSSPNFTHTEAPANQQATPSIHVERELAEAEVAVRHDAPLASSLPPVQDAGEEPIALPLHVSEGPNAGTKREVLSSVVGQVPAKTAVLAPQLPKHLVPAKLMYSMPAQYPAMARQIHSEGEVILRLDVDAAGNVADAKAVSGAPLLRAAALDAVRKWKYQPATLGDKPVASTETVKIDFHLK
jgi:TonB family protein